MRNRRWGQKMKRSAKNLIKKKMATNLLFFGICSKLTSWIGGADMNQKRILNFVPLLAAAMVSWFSCHAEADVIASYQFEEGTIDTIASGADSVVDSSGNGLNGSPIGDPVYRNVGGSQGLEFDGDDRIFIADDPLFALTQSLTIEAMIRINALSTTKQIILFRGDSRGGLDPYTFNIRADGVLRFQIQNELNEGATVRSPDPLPLGEYLHVAGTLNDATDEMKLFVNGQLVATTITSRRPFGTLDTSTNPGLGIGSRQDGSDDYFNGIIDNLRIHNVAIAVPEPSSTCFLAATFLGWLSLTRRRILTNS